MKLRNKKTGEIVEATDYNIMSDYNSLAELNEEWEDYKEPKKYWYIYGGHVFENECDEFMEGMFEATGNRFETKEEAEKAVEKLKAWKRLKDNGFRFDGWEWKYQKARYIFDFTVLSEDGEKQAEKDLDLLFGGEDE